MNLVEFSQIQNRRRFFRNCAGGLGTIALWHLLAAEGRTAENRQPANPMLVRPPHFKPRARNVIFLFMAGAPSQLDLMDPKPVMKKWHGQPVPASLLADLQDPLIKGSATVMASPREFQRYGQAGMEFSDFLPTPGRWPMSFVSCARCTPIRATTTRPSC